MRLWWGKIRERVRSIFQAQGRSYTLLIVPSATSRVRKIVVRELFLKRAAVVAGIGAFLLGLLLVDYARSLSRGAELKRLRAETAAQRVKAAQVAEGLAELEQGMSRLRTLEGRLRTAFDLDPGLLNPEPETGGGAAPAGKGTHTGIGGRDSSQEPRAGSGGARTGKKPVKGGGDAAERQPAAGAKGGETSLADTAGSPVASLDERATRVSLDLEQMKGRVEAQERGFFDLVRFLEDRKALLASTPSIMPVRGWMSSGFQRRIDPFSGNTVWHRGLDIATDTGTPVLATADGVVNGVERCEDLGHLLSIDHGHGYLTRYGHNSKIIVRDGQPVRRGQVIALVGNTGKSTGPHLHYEVFHNGVPVNPLNYIID